MAKRKTWRDTRKLWCKRFCVTEESIKDKYVHHRDGNPENNFIDNLECLTPLEHAQRHPGRASGKRSSEICEKFSQRMLKEWANGTFVRKPRSSKYWKYIETVKRRYYSGKTVASIAKDLGINYRRVYDILNGKIRRKDVPHISVRLF